MAKGKTVKVKALVNLKYDKECKEKDEELRVRVEDALDMAKKGYIKLLEEVPQENEEEGTEEPPKDGE